MNRNGNMMGQGMEHPILLDPRMAQKMPSPGHYNYVPSGLPYPMVPEQPYHQHPPPRVRFRYFYHVHQRTGTKPF
jgi:hypothetical protein